MRSFFISPTTAFGWKSACKKKRCGCLKFRWGNSLDVPRKIADSRKCQSSLPQYEKLCIFAARLE